MAGKPGWRLKTDARWDVLEAEREHSPPTGQLDLEDLLMAQPTAPRPAAEPAPARTAFAAPAVPEPTPTKSPARKVDRSTWQASRR